MDEIESEVTGQVEEDGTITAISLKTLFDKSKNWYKVMVTKDDQIIKESGLIESKEIAGEIVKEYEGKYLP
jgi:hypothetical protein